MTQRPIITVDGSSGSGKTTLGRRLAGRLGLALVDTGLVYRGIMVAAVRAGVTGADTERLVELARTTDLAVNTDPDLATPWHVRVDGIDAEALLRDPAHAILLSTLSQVPGVRAELLPVQRRLGRGGAVVVGRDCGTVVFPGADVKFWLEASPTVRLERREAQLLAAGTVVDAATVAADVSGRDRLDAPSMLQAANAHRIDTGVLDADAVLAEALRICVSAGLG